MEDNKIIISKSKFFSLIILCQFITPQIMSILINRMDLEVNLKRVISIFLNLSISILIFIFIYRKSFPKIIRKINSIENYRYSTLIIIASIISSSIILNLLSNLNNYQLNFYSSIINSNKLLGLLTFVILMPIYDITLYKQLYFATFKESKATYIFGIIIHIFNFSFLLNNGSTSINELPLLIPNTFIAILIFYSYFKIKSFAPAYTGLIIINLLQYIIIVSN